MCRIYPDPYTCNPRPLYAALDALDLRSPSMVGWWDEASPIRVSAPEVRATLFLSGRGRAAVALANWGASPIDTILDIDVAKLARLAAWDHQFGSLAQPSVNSTATVPKGRYTRVELRASPIAGFQPRGAWAQGEAIHIQGKSSGFNEGWLIELTRVVVEHP